MNNGRKGKNIFHKNFSPWEHGFTENSGTMFTYENTELLPFLRNYSKNHVFDQPSPRNGKGTYLLSNECINK